MLFDKNNRFNLANLITFGNIASGVVAIHFYTKWWVPYSYSSSLDCWRVGYFRW